MEAQIGTDKRQAAFFNTILIEEMAESKRLRSMVLIALLGFQGVFLFLIVIVCFGYTVGYQQEVC